ncbi:hypothetical protein M2164_000112 [Streptomyces sp. SAI-208]|uniref:hypothetical protein n=1 Tax=Streptomyces sp. SAI-208 TaxID=2940550 RepID=UPI002476F43A|nr:hypothetical protein [Streptomyces sp. SAI-208]MDH6604477.1 hypothetical protein [Streptomyces sp. SAI-208]
MTTKSNCGPQADPEFFKALNKLFEQYPQAADRYMVKSMSLELDVLKIDFRTQVGVSRVEDGRIITEFVDRDPTRDRDCCGYWHSECVLICDDPPV